MAIEPEMSDEQFAEEIKDLVRRLNLASRAAHDAGLLVGFDVREVALFMDKKAPRSQLDVSVARPL